VLADGCLPACPAAARFTRAGLCGAVWPRWSGNDDPRQRALADGYQFLLGLPGTLAAPGRNMTEGCS